MSLVYGQQYPCPAYLFPPDFQIICRAAVPEGQCPVEYRGYIVHPSIRSKRPWPGGGGMDVHTDETLPAPSTGHCPSGTAAQKGRREPVAQRHQMVSRSLALRS